jgi:prepilin signal peptidase PulO-like enzyme (type II secretory pathway)
MVGALLGSGILIVVLFVALAAIFYYIVSWRNARTGEHGVVQRSRLVCPKCHQTFDYEWVPLAAATAVRLGRSRYMACPVCRRWSVFNVYDAPAPPTPAP